MLLLLLIAACRGGEEELMAFGQRCGDAEDGAPDVRSLPGGQRLAWSGASRVWALISGCDQPVLVWDGEGEALSVEWSADGAELAFISDGRVLVVASDQAGVRAEFEGSAYSWLPDGRLFLERPGEPQGGVGSVADPSTGTVKDVVTAYGSKFWPSPDGSLTAYANYEDCPPGSIPAGAPTDYHCSTIWVSAIDGTDEHKLVGIADMLDAVPDDVHLIQGMIYPVDLQWSNTGQWLMFRTCGISASLCLDERYVFEIRPDGTGLHYVSDTVGSIDWSPDDSRYILVQEGGRYYDAYPRPMTVRTPGSDDADVTSPADVEDREPQWSPDGEQVVFVSSPSIRTGVCQLCPPEVPEQGIWITDGEVRTQLTSSPEWQDTSPAWSRDGEWILFIRNGPEYTENQGFARTGLWMMRRDGSDQHMVANPSQIIVDELPGGRTLSYDWWTAQ